MPQFIMLVGTVTILSLLSGIAVRCENPGTFHQGLFLLVDDRVEKFTDIISNHHVMSWVECGQQCLGHEICIFFNYKSIGILHNETNCQTLSKKTTPEMCTKGDWKLYKILNPCSRKNLCQNGGKCVTNTTLPLGFQCECNITYDGEFCETKLGTCAALMRKHHSLPSGSYYIHPEGVRYSRFKVYCDMISKNGVGITVIGHDSEARMRVDGFEDAGSYQRKVQYNLTMEKITVIINTSQECEQFISYECHGSILLTKSFGWWVSRQGENMTYWGGAAIDSGKCACGMTNTCANGYPCNCDANDPFPRQDSGFLSDKNTLPVTELRFGDTGSSTEYGFHTLGKLQCWG